MKRIVLFIFFVLPFTVTGQTESNDMLTWSSKRLSWDDYKAKPDPDSDAAASTATVLSIDYSISSKSFGYKIKSYFSKARSWGLHKTDYILRHEQGHFDIAEIYARKLHKRMQEYVFNKRTYQKDLKKIYEDVAEEKSEMQEEYDKETRHSINREKQAEWLKKIERLLNEYKDYGDY
jgi:predicted secreted Zn-dependent protease